MTNPKKSGLDIKTLGVIGGLVLTAVLLYVGFENHVFTSPGDMQHYVAQFGWAAPTVFILFLISQVVFPVFPGALNLVAGIYIFGPINGFFYNYIGVVIGSIIAFQISRHYGLTLIRKVTSRKIFDKYVDWIQKPDFERLFMFAMFFPIAPDDLLCYLAGVSKMSFRKFLTIILTGKVVGVITYTFGIKYLIIRLLAFFKW